jgi:hypothetical protein
MSEEDIELRNKLKNSKIWIGENPELSKKLQLRLFKLGL